MTKSNNEYNILVVDDEPTIASTLGIILRQKGFEVSTFTNPLKALESVHTKAPDFLLADVIMPEMSGIGLATAHSQQRQANQVSNRPRLQSALHPVQFQISALEWLRQI